MVIDLTDPQKALAECTADVIDEMLRIDGEASVVWRQASRALRTGDVGRALELLDKVRGLCAEAQVRAGMAAKGIFVLGAMHAHERMRPDKATGEDLEALINLTTPPPDKSGSGDN